MTIPWRDTIASIKTTLTHTSGPDTAIGAELRKRIENLGKYYDFRWPPAPAPSRPTLQTESQEHIAWRAALAVQIADLDKLAAAADGGPRAVYPADNPSAAWDAALARLQASAGSTDAATATVVTIAISQAKKPAEPPFFVADYYSAAEYSRTSDDFPRRLVGGRPPIPWGELEAQLIAAIAAAERWIALSD